MESAPHTRIQKRHARRLARGLVVSSAGATLAWGCLVSPPPIIDGPEPERPNVNASQVVPPTYQTLVATSGTPIEITIPVQSEDAGDKLWALIWVNWNHERELFIRKTPFAPAPDLGMGGAGSSERPISITWSPDSRMSPGCNLLTIFLVNERYADLQVTDEPNDFNKAAMVNWWVNVDPPTGREQDLLGCPSPSVPTATFP